MPSGLARLAVPALAAGPSPGQEGGGRPGFLTLALGFSLNAKEMSVVFSGQLEPPIHRMSAWHPGSRHFGHRLLLSHQSEALGVAVGGCSGTSTCFQTPPEVCGATREDGAAMFVLSPRPRRLVAMRGGSAESPQGAAPDLAGTSPLPKQSDLTLTGSRVPLPPLLTSSGIAGTQAGLDTLV